MVVNYQNSGAFNELKKILTDRMKVGADRDAIDREIWSQYGGKYAVMFTDLAGFSRHVMEFGIIHFLQIIIESQRILSDVITDHGGELIMTESDSMLIIFAEPDAALRCGFAMQQCCFAYNIDKPKHEQILLCIGIGFGECLKIGTEDIFGAEVNAASKLGEDTALPGEILLTNAFRKALGENADFAYELLEVVPSGSVDRAYRCTSNC